MSWQGSSKGNAHEFAGYGLPIADQIQKKPMMKPLAVSLGDPAGIGPEIVARALTGFKPRGGTLLFGDPNSVPKRWRSGLKACVWRPLVAGAWTPGRPSAASGEAAFQSVTRSAKAVLAGEARALVTAPLSKEALHLAGRHWPGHTELLAHLAGKRADEVGMLLVGGGLRVFLITRHCSLKQALAALKVPVLDQALSVCVRGLRGTLGLRHPRLALAALNPHAGENGAFGSEERSLLNPWVRARARTRTFLLEGPFPADTVFVRAVRGAYDAVLCLYHDQGLIPLKLLAFDSGVNITLGLPFVRTSPDHGTAWDLAGKGTANPLAMLEALRLADRHGV
ncbi:MAG: 4-hydroxythreonine-4-phosphate dehydrogenase PdxA [bacterium]